jgi:hypothetical protein
MKSSSSSSPPQPSSQLQQLPRSISNRNLAAAHEERISTFPTPSTIWFPSSWWRWRNKVSLKLVHQMVHMLTWWCFSVRQSNPYDVGFCKMDTALITWCQSKGEKLLLGGFFFFFLCLASQPPHPIARRYKTKVLVPKVCAPHTEAQVRIQTKPLLVSNRYSNPKGQWFAINPHSWKNYFRVA